MKISLHHFSVFSSHLLLSPSPCSLVWGEEDVRGMVWGWRRSINLFFRSPRLGIYARNPSVYSLCTRHRCPNHSEDSHKEELITSSLASLAALPSVSSSLTPSSNHITNHPPHERERKSGWCEWLGGCEEEEETLRPIPYMCWS